MALAAQQPAPRTLRVRFADRLVGAALAPPVAPLPPLRRTVPSVNVQTPPPVAFDAVRELRADRARITAAVDALRAAAADLKARQAEQMDQLQQAAVHLALGLATRVFHRAVLAGEFPLELMAREMAAELADDAPTRVRLHPDDLALLVARLDGDPLLADAEPKLVADATLARGTVAVDGAAKTLRADPVRTLEEIRDELLRSLGHDARP